MESRLALPSLNYSKKDRSCKVHQVHAVHQVHKFKRICVAPSHTGHRFGLAMARDLASVRKSAARRVTASLHYY